MNGVLLMMRKTRSVGLPTFQILNADIFYTVDNTPRAFPLGIHPYINNVNKTLYKYCLVKIPSPLFRPVQRY